MNEQTPADADRRRSRRQRPKATTEIICRSEARIVGSNLAVSILDISADGIQLMVNAPLKKGQRIDVDLQGIGYCRPLQLIAEVVWSLETAEGQWCVGAKF